MDERTRRNVGYLDGRYRSGIEEGRYYAHEPVFGVGCDHSEPYQAAKIARTYSLFRRLAQMRFESLLDVGGSEGYHANLARRLFSAKVVTSDLSFEANLRARELFGLPAVASDAHWLPYPDESFDVVLCCEVLEHVSDPVAVMCEVARVARRYAVLTTEQTSKLPREREIRLLLADMESPHSELHWFLSDDFATVLGGPIAQERQALVTERLAEQLSAGREPHPEEIRELALEMTRLWPSARPELGILVVKAKGGAALPDISQEGNEALLDAILAERVEAEPAPGRASAGLDSFLRERLACPVCLGPLHDMSGELSCSGCGRRSAVDRGVPRLYLMEGGASLGHQPAARWPWLTEEGSKLRDLFTAPRMGRSRLLCHLLSLELALLGVCEGLPAPAVDYANSTRLRRALEKAAAGYELPEAASRAHLPWWDRLPASAAEIEAMRALGANVVRLVTRVTGSNEVMHSPASLPVRVLRRLKRALPGAIGGRRHHAEGRRAGDAAVADDGLFHPERPATRGEMAVLVARAVAGGDAEVPQHRDDPSFPDVHPSDPRYDYVEYALAKNAMFGYADGLFHPEYPVNRGEMAVLLARALAGGEATVPEPTGEPSFADVSPGDPLRKYAEYLLAASVVTRSPDGRYRPEETVDRGQMALLVARAVAGGEAGIRPAPQTATFSDVKPGDEGHRYVEYLVARGILLG